MEKTNTLLKRGERGAYRQGKEESDMKHPKSRKGQGRKDVPPRLNQNLAKRQIVGEKREGLDGVGKRKTGRGGRTYIGKKGEETVVIRMGAERKGNGHRGRRKGRQWDH